jgi:hypothetical protein
MIFNGTLKQGLENSFGLPQSRLDRAPHISLLTCSEPRGSAPEPRGFAPEPRGSVREPRGFASEPRGFVTEPRGSGAEPRGFVTEPRGSGAEPRGSDTETGRCDGRVWWVADPVMYMCVSDLVVV